MKTAARRALLCGVFILSFLLCIESQAHALFQLEVSPRRGGQHLRFDAGGPGGVLRNEEVEVRIETDEAAPYLIQLAVHQPLTNQFGNTIPQQNFFVFSPSSPLGSLRVQLETPLTMGQRTLYTSNSAGDTDSFFLVFNVNLPEDQPGGTYRTQLIFTAEPSSSASFPPAIRTMDVQVEVRPTFRAQIRAARGGSQIQLGRIDKDHPAAAENIAVLVESNIGTPYRMTQQLSAPLVSERGEMMPEEALSFEAAGARNGKLVAGGGPTALSMSPAAIYESDQLGQGEAFEMRYTASPALSQKAGVYTGSITYRFESSSPLVPPDSINLPVRVEVTPIFHLDVEMREGLGIHFGSVKPGTSRQARDVTLSVKSNLSEPYQISQIVSRPLGDAEGYSLPKEAFTFVGERTPTGSVTATSPRAVEAGETVVFTSDPKGTPETVTLSYALEIPLDSKPGSYGSELKYSITTL